MFILEKQKNIKIYNQVISEKDCDKIEVAIIELLQHTKPHEDGKRNIVNPNNQDIIEFTRKYDQIIKSLEPERLKDCFMTKQVANLFSHTSYGSLGAHSDYHAGDRGHMSAVAYFTDPSDYQGGEISFPKLNWSIKPLRGTIICYPQKYVHEVYKVTAGQRTSIALAWALEKQRKNRGVDPYPYF